MPFAMVTMALTTSWSMGCCGEAADEVAVDLDVVERQALEVGEGRAAGAEVVEGQAAAAVVQSAAQTLRGLDVADRGGLGQLEDEARGVDATLVELAIDVRGKARVTDRPTR